MDTLKERIQHEIHLFDHISLENYFSLARKVEIKTMGTIGDTTNIVMQQFRQKNINKK